MSTIRRVTKRDRPAALKRSAEKHQELLTQAVLIARRRASRRRSIIREILASTRVEGLAERLNAKAAALTYRVPKYRRTWHTLIPWQNLEHSTPEAEADSILQTVALNLRMTESNSWPKSPRSEARPKSARKRQ
jgi:hypothetical protein